MDKCGTLHDALKMLVGEYGKELYRDKKMINYISDYYHFDPMALFTVMKSIVKGGYAEGLLDASTSDSWMMYVQKSMSKLQNQYGFDGKYVNYCFQSLAYGLGIFPQINQVLLDMVNGKQVAPPSPPSSSAPQSKGQTGTGKTSQRKKSSSSAVGSNTSRTSRTSTTPPPPPQVRIPAQRKQRNSINISVHPSKPSKSDNCMNGCSNVMIIMMILYFIGKCSEG